MSKETIEVEGTLTLKKKSRRNLWGVKDASPAPEPEPEFVRPPKPEPEVIVCPLRRVRVRIRGSDGKFKWEKHAASHVDVKGGRLYLRTVTATTDWLWYAPLHYVGTYMRPEKHEEAGEWVHRDPVNKATSVVVFARGSWVSYMAEEFADE